MIFFKNTLKNLLRILIYFTIFSLVLTIIYYFNLINYSTLNYIRLIGFIIIIYFSKSKDTRRINKNNLLDGLLTGLGIIIIFLIINIITKYKIDIKLILYYLLIIGICILGSFRKKRKL